MRIPRRTVSIGSLSLTALALGGVLFAQNAPDKSADNIAGGERGTRLPGGQRCQAAETDLYPQPRDQPGGERGVVSGYSHRDGNCVRRRRCDRRESR